MPQKYSFRDPQTQVLKAWGYMEANAPGDIRQAEAEDFSLDLRVGAWQWDGTQWQPFSAPRPAPSALAQALDTALTDMLPLAPQIQAVFVEWRKQVR